MKFSQKFLAAVFVFLLLTLPAAAQTTITITYPTNNTQDLSCFVNIQATHSLGVGDEQGGTAKVTITNLRTNVKVVNYQDMSPGTGMNSWQYSWSTMGFSNDQYSIQCFFPYREVPPGSGGGIAQSALVNVSVKNGWLVVNGPETYAKVNNPVNVTIKQGDSFTVSTDHKVTFERFDDCGYYIVTYEYRQSTSWDPTLTSKRSGTLRACYEL